MTKLAPGLQSQMTAAAISSARPSRPTRLVPHDLLHRIRLARQHGCDHRRFDGPRAHGVDADAPGCIFERSALRQPDHPVLRRVIDGSARKAHEPAERGAVDDRATSLGAHLTQLVFHAAPDAAEIDRDGAIEFVAAGVGGLHGRSLHAGIVERRIQPTEGGHRLVEHGLDLRFIGHVAANRHRFVTCGEQLLCSRPCRSFIDICHNHCRARGSESLRGREPNALTGAGHERHLTFVGQVRWCRVAHIGLPFDPPWRLVETSSTDAGQGCARSRSRTRCRRTDGPLSQA